MAKAKSNRRAQAPKVRIVQVGDRTLQLRYRDPDSGSEVRISTGTHDRKQAAKQRRELLAKLRKGDCPKPAKPVTKGSMSWADFREHYRELKKFRSDKARVAAEVRLDICERIIEPKRLRDIADSHTLMLLQAKLANGRSPHTVKSYMASLVAALNWAHKMGWLPSRAQLDWIKTTHLETHKGRPISRAEFQAMLDACDTACATKDPASWRFLLRGLWHSGLRLGEALSMTWDVEGTIRPYRHRSGHVVLEIPAGRQKNRRDQTVPTTPDFGLLLDEVPAERRRGFVFNPQKLHGSGRYADALQCGRVITRIAKKAGIFVTDTKPASAQDLRRSFGQCLADAGVTPRDLQAIMRHKQFTTTEKYYLKHNAADQAERIASILGYGGANRTQLSEEVESTQVVDT